MGYEIPKARYERITCGDNTEIGYFPIGLAYDFNSILSQGQDIRSAITELNERPNIVTGNTAYNLWNALYYAHPDAFLEAKPATFTQRNSYFQALFGANLAEKKGKILELGSGGNAQGRWDGIFHHTPQLDATRITLSDFGEIPPVETSEGCSLAQTVINLLDQSVESVSGHDHMIGFYVLDSIFLPEDKRYVMHEDGSLFEQTPFLYIDLQKEHGVRITELLNENDFATLQAEFSLQEIFSTIEIIQANIPIRREELHPYVQSFFQKGYTGITKGRDIASLNVPLGKAKLLERLLSSNPNATFTFMDVGIMPQNRLCDAFSKSGGIAGYRIEDYSFLTIWLQQQGYKVTYRSLPHFATQWRKDVDRTKIERNHFNQLENLDDHFVIEVSRR